MTAAIVLAAGLGRRLSSITALPKWLTPVGDTCPADAQLEALASVDDLDTTYVIVNSADEEIERFVEPWRERLVIELVPNDHSTTRNNWYSALIGLERCLRDGHLDMVLLNSDLFARPDWFAASIDAILTSTEEAALAIDRSRGDRDEEMKVSVDGEGSCITGIGKSGIDSPGGEYVGLARWTATSARELSTILRAFEPRAECADHWYEHGIDEHLRAGARYGLSPVASTSWVEIDDRNDFDQARRLADPPDG